MHLHLHPTWGRRSWRRLLPGGESQQLAVQRQLSPERRSSTWARLSQPEDPAARARYGELYPVAAEGKKCSIYLYFLIWSCFLNKNALECNCPVLIGTTLQIFESHVHESAAVPFEVATLLRVCWGICVCSAVWSPERLFVAPPDTLFGLWTRLSE